MTRLVLVIASSAALTLAASAEASTMNAVNQSQVAPTRAAQSTYESFYTSVSASVLSYSGSLQVRGYASYRDYSCSPSYTCDRNVMVKFIVHRGYSTYSPIVGTAYAQTGQYGTSVSSTFKLPSCRVLPRYQSITYTIEMFAVAPNGQQRAAQTSAYLRSCA
jgi:hypothetical protein